MGLKLCSWGINITWGLKIIYVGSLCFYFYVNQLSLYIKNHRANYRQYFSTCRDHEVILIQCELAFGLVDLFLTLCATFSLSFYCSINNRGCAAHGKYWCFTVLSSAVLTSLWVHDLHTSIHLCSLDTHRYFPIPTASLYLSLIFCQFL